MNKNVNFFGKEMPLRTAIANYMDKEDIKDARTMIFQKKKGLSFIDYKKPY